MNVTDIRFALSRSQGFLFDPAFPSSYSVSGVEMLVLQFIKCAWTLRTFSLKYSGHKFVADNCNYSPYIHIKSFIIKYFRSRANVTWPNILQFSKPARVAQNIWRWINTIAYIWGENIIALLSLDFSLLKHIFAPYGGYCLFCCFLLFFFIGKISLNHR